jgi:hypothetical protein
LLHLVRKLDNLASTRRVTKVVLMMATASTTIQGLVIDFTLPFEQKLEWAVLVLQNWLLSFCLAWHELALDATSNLGQMGASNFDSRYVQRSRSIFFCF